MSRIGNKPIDVPSGVTVNATDACVSVKGPKGELSFDLSGGISVDASGEQLIVQRPDESKQSRSSHGLVRSILNNMVEGVAKGFTRELEIEGVGFKATIQGQKLVLAVGFSKPVEYVVPDGVSISEEGGTRIIVSGPDKQKVGEVAARIRAFSPAEPYKGKGLRYKGERVRRKVGKTVA